MVVLFYYIGVIKVETMKQWKLELLFNLIKHKRKDPSKLTFVHTPKCAGTYAATVLSALKIKNLGHKSATSIKDPSVLTFTIIREPVARFESMLNFRFERKIRQDWPTHLYQAFYNTNLKLNWYVNHMTDKQIKSFTPFNNLPFWTNNVDICLTIDELQPFLESLGYTYPTNLPPKNISKKTRGTLNPQTRTRLSKLFTPDIHIYNLWTQNDKPIQETPTPPVTTM